MRIAPVAFVMAGLLTPLFLGAGCVQGSVTLPTPSESSDAVVKPSSDFSSSKTTAPMANTFPGKLTPSEIENKQIRLTTAKGDIVIQLYPDTAPLTVSNFVSLASKGYYDGLIFHRVIKGFMIQGGDPTGTGMGGPGYKFEDELNDTHTYERGTVAMANSGPNTNGSQFFIMHQDVPLPHLYSIFGKVTSGLEFVDAIAGTTVDGGDRPLAEQKIVKVTVEDVK
ncbi:MAG: peptidylprolyl isomerase [Patescibacteria group bacterium]|jgi:cyclophilin family peptidyl-prolyl cis-trans isomerase